MLPYVVATAAAGILMVIILIGIAVGVSNSQKKIVGHNCPPCPPDGGSGSGTSMEGSCGRDEKEEEDYLAFLDRFGEQFKGAMGDKLLTLGENYTDDKLLDYVKAVEKFIKKKAVEQMCGQYKDLSWESMDEADIDYVKEVIRETEVGRTLSEDDLTIWTYIYVDFVCKLDK